MFCEGNKDDMATEMFLTGHCVCVFCEGNEDMANEMFLTGHMIASPDVSCGGSFCFNLSQLLGATTLNTSR